MAVNRRQIVDPPTFSPLPFGLLSVVQLPPSGDAHWQNGVTYQSRCLVSVDTTYDACLAVTGGPDGLDTPPDPSDLEGNTFLETRGATAFTVYSQFDCSAVGIANAQKIAEDAISQSAPWAVERAFWTGQAGDEGVVFPHLAANAEVTDGDIVMQSAATLAVTGGPNLVVSLGLLEQSIADCSNGQGVIHVQRKVLPALFNQQLVEARGGQLFTKSGNLVAAGAGYPGTGPAGDAITGTTSYMYATGPVFGRSSTVTYSEDVASFDRSTNTRKMIAERTYLLGWDCCHIAVKVDLDPSAA